MKKGAIQHAFKSFFSEYCIALEKLNVKASNVASSQTASQMSVLKRVTQLIKAKDEVMLNIEHRSVAAPRVWEWRALPDLPCKGKQRITQKYTAL